MRSKQPAGPGFIKRKCSKLEKWKNVVQTLVRNDDHDMPGPHFWFALPARSARCDPVFGAYQSVRRYSGSSEAMGSPTSYTHHPLWFS